MKILFLEPHPDDLILSAFNFIENISSDEHELFGVTFCHKSVSNLSRNSSKYFEMMNIKNLNKILNIKDIEQVFYNECSKYISMESIYNHYEIYSKLYPVTNKHIHDTMYECLSYVCPDLVVSPLGLLHMAHVLTKGNLSRLWFGDILYYLDLPYIGRLSEKEQKRIYNLTHERKILSDEKFSRKMKLFTELYPSESYMIKDFDEYNIYKNEYLIWRFKNAKM